MKSVWTDSVNLPEFPSLTGNVKTDVLIIGGGMAGILTAYFLQKNGVRYILVEKDKICGGATKNTTAKITFQHGLIYDRILKDSGEDSARKYLLANRLAFEEYAKMCKTIDCDYEIKDNYVYSTNNRQKLEDEMKALDEINFNEAQFVDKVDLPLNTVGAVRFPNQAQFNPLKFISAIVGRLHIYENTFVKEMASHIAVTNKGKIHFKRVICATHFPFINNHGSYFLKLYQHRSYVIALKNAENVNGMYVDECDKGLSFRNYKDLLLLGGGGHRTGKDGGNWQELRRFAKQFYTQSKEEYFWATQDCMSLDGIPYIGQYSKSTPNFYVASGFNKWGMTNSMVSAKILCDMILGKPNEYADAFNPARSILEPQLFVNGFESTKNLLTVSEKRCPHLGCALKWNKAEHSWDCPCHGSRFSKDGKVLDNPANGDLKK